MVARVIVSFTKLGYGLLALILNTLGNGTGASVFIALLQSQSQQA